MSQVDGKLNKNSQVNGPSKKYPSVLLPSRQVLAYWSVGLTAQKQ